MLKPKHEQSRDIGGTELTRKAARSNPDRIESELASEETADSELISDKEN